MQNFYLKNKKERIKANKLVIFSAFLFIFIFLISFSSAAIQVGLDGSTNEIGPIKQDSNVLLYQTCNECTYCNFTKILSPNSDIILSNIQTNKDNTFYSYLLGSGNITTPGQYKYFYDCGNSTNSITGKINFNVTPSGRDGNNNIALVIILIVIIYAVTLISFFGRNLPLSILTGMFMSFFGLWIIRNGIVIYRDNLTNYFGYVTITIGAIIAIWAAIELTQDN